MICKKCGTENGDLDLFCNNCGAPLKEVDSSQQQSYQQPSYQQPSYQQPNYQQPASQEDTTPISMWGYFGYQILFSIPCIGFIFLLIFSFGGTKNVNLKNFARSYFCFLIIAFILMIILAATGAFASIFAAANYY